MPINEQAARIAHHTSTTTGAFTVPASEDFTDGSWDKFDLAKSEIGVNEADNKVYIRVGGAVVEMLTSVGGIGSLADTLAIGNTTSGNDITLSSGDILNLTDTSNGLYEDSGEVILYSGGTMGFYCGASSSASLDGLGALRTNSLGTSEYIELNPKGESIYYNNGTYYTQLQYTAPTSNNIITIPDSSGTLAFTTDSLGGSDQTSTTTAFRKLILGTALATGGFAIRNSVDSADLITFNGDETVRTDSEWGFGSNPNSTRVLNIQTSTHTQGIYISNTKDNSQGLRSTSNATGGSNFGAIIEAVGVGATTNYGLRLKSIGATNNYALEIQAGDIKTPSGTGQTGTYTFGGGSSGDIATMQYENGILIATTTVP